MRVERRRPPVAAILLSLIAIIGLPGGAVVPPAASAATALTALYIDGGWLAPDGAWYQSSISSTFVATYDSPTGTAHITITKPGDDPHSWNLYFAAPTGQQLGQGVYSNAVRWPFHDASHPGFDLNRLFQGCNEESGAFTITDWQLDGTTITALALSFTHECESGINGITRGELRVGSMVGLKAVTPSPTSLDFGEAVTGRPTASKTITISGRGNLVTDISAVSIAGPQAADFEKTSDTCTGASLAAGATCKIGVRFVGKALGAREAQLSITDSTFIGTHHDKLTGTGVGFSISPASIDFGAVPVGTHAKATVSILSGLEPLQVTYSDSLIPLGFSLAPGTGCSNLAALKTCTTTVTFWPTSVGAQTGSIAWTIVRAGNFYPASTNLAGTAVQTSNVSWGSDRSAGRTWTWTDGYGLGKTASGSTTYLHVIEATDYVGSKFATDTGPYVGVYYVRTSNEGSTWTASARLNSTSQHGERPSLAASGSMVYTSWVTQTKYIKFSPTAPRVLYVRANTNHGSSTAWRSAVRVTSSTGRVDFPTLAANGSTVYAAYTDSNTGNIRLSKSIDKGAHWTSKTLGVTSASTTQGKTGYPVVRVNGTRVIVVWTGDNAGKILARISLDNGTTWGSTGTLTSTSNGFATAAASADRFAVAWTAGDGPRVRTNKAGAWGTTRSITIGTSNAYVWHDTPAISLNGTNGTAVAWGACFAGCDKAGAIDLLWAESTDGGVTFPHLQVIAGQDIGANWWPSIAWSGTKRYVLYERDSDGGSYRLRIRTGTGSP